MCSAPRSASGRWSIGAGGESDLYRSRDRRARSSRRCCSRRSRSGCSRRSRYAWSRAPSCSRPASASSCSRCSRSRWCSGSAAATARAGVRDREHGDQRRQARRVAARTAARDLAVVGGRARGGGARRGGAGRRSRPRAAAHPAAHRGASCASCEPYRQVLARLALFDGVSEPALERVAAGMAHVALHRRRRACSPRATRPTTSTWSAAARSTCSAATPGRGARGRTWFGEIGLLRHTPRTAASTRRRGATCGEIPGQEFLAAITEAASPPSALLDGCPPARGAGRARRGQGRDTGSRDPTTDDRRP